MERLLLDVYGSIGEPDGIYAVARSGDMASQLRLMQHEGVFAFCELSVYTTSPEQRRLDNSVTMVTGCCRRASRTSSL